VTTQELPRDLYPRVLGDAWWALPEPVRLAHAVGGEVRGRFRISHGKSWIARRLARWSRLPRESEAAPTVLKISAEGAGERWDRNFAGVEFSTSQWATDDQQLVEGFNGWELVIAAVLVIEIALTMWDFVIEIVVRKPLGDVYAGERVTHAIMGIIYGAMVALLIPVMWGWWALPTRLAVETRDVPSALVALLLIMAAGVFTSGVRDLYAALELPYGNWPWPKNDRAR